jgi:probable F420-dependent oxidoreductase
MEIAGIADRNGFRRLWTTERPGRDALLRAAELAFSTRRIGVATGIAYAFSRHPIAMAGAAAELDRLSGGRFLLGLGTGTRGMRTRWFNDETFDHPAPRLAEYCDLVHAVLQANGRGCAFTGKYYGASIPGFAIEESSEAAQTVDLPVYGSGLNPIMLRIMARRCDGVALHPLAGAPRYLSKVAGPALQLGRAEAVRDARLACWLLVAISQDEEEALAAARRQLAFYFTTPSYAGVADVSGWGEVTAKLRLEFKEVGPQWDRLGRLVPEDMISSLCPSGTPSDVVAQVKERVTLLEEYGIDEVVFEPAAIGSSRDEIVTSFRLTAEHLGDS